MLFIIIKFISSNFLFKLVVSIWKTSVAPRYLNNNIFIFFSLNLNGLISIQGVAKVLGTLIVEKEVEVGKCSDTF